MELKRENSLLKDIVRERMKDKAPELLEKHNTQLPSVVAESMAEATSLLERRDFNLVKALQTAQQSFVVTDPSLPDNPIVFASQGFLEMTGYRMDQVLGRNCRFLQGPDTDPKKIDAIRKGVAAGERATSVTCITHARTRRAIVNRVRVWMRVGPSLTPRRNPRGRHVGVHHELQVGRHALLEPVFRGTPARRERQDRLLRGRPVRR
jgi:PAS domain-containing protein